MSKALKILSRPQGNAEEYGRWAVNPYKGCSHGCLYCYLKKGVWANGLGGSAAELKTGVFNEEHAYHLAMTEIYANFREILRDGGLFMTFTSDPCIEKTRAVFFQIASESAKELGIPVTILTKSADFISYWRFMYITSGTLDNNGRIKSRLFFGWTLTGHDELEPDASPNAKRIEAMRLVSSYGFKTWASIEPVIDFPSSLDMIYQALNAGCQHFKIGLLTNNTRVVRKPFEFGEHQFKAYDVRDCLHFIEDVMRLTDGKATVYWKQSVVDFCTAEAAYYRFSEEEVRKAIMDYPHSVGKDWSMFNKED
jgi:DNA repair photolyase